MNRNDMLRGLYDLIILSIIKKNDGLLSQYAVYKQINSSYEDYNIKINESTIYDAIRRLRNNQYLIIKDKKMVITSSGEEYYSDKVDEWEKVKEFVAMFI